MLFSINRRYNFTTYAPGLFSDSFKLAKVIGIVSYNTAKQHANVDVMQRQVYPLLPVGTPDRVSEYSYILFESTAGLRFVLAYPWIIESSIQEVAAINLTVNIYDVDDSDANKVRDVLNSMGYSFVLEQITP